MTGGQERESLSSRLGFLLISAGCAIGLGNVWRLVAKQLARPHRGPAPVESSDAPGGTPLPAPDELATGTKL